MTTGVDRNKKIVTMQDGTTIAYDRLIVSPGIGMVWDSLPGYSEEATEITPHTCKAGPQAKFLRDRIDALKDGENNPYRGTAQPVPLPAWSL